MNINKTAEQDNDLSRFLEFTDYLDVIILKEDWGNMCGITISKVSGGYIPDSICFSFHDDGSFRSIFYASQENKRTLFLQSLKKELEYIGFWGLIKLWWKNRKIII